MVKSGLAEARDSQAIANCYPRRVGGTAVSRCRDHAQTSSPEGEAGFEQCRTKAAEATNVGKPLC
eukprot:12890774-Prorocentrum_lima.AAC.1